MTLFEIVFKPSVYVEIQQIIDYYNFKSAGLGERFFKSLSQKMEDLKLNPFYQIRYKKSRMTVLDKFPYVVHFKIIEKTNTVVILAVLHGNINPKKWTKFQ